MNEVKYRTDFLFPKRNFWTGVSTTINIAGNGNKINTSSSDLNADCNAILVDWKMIGQDFKNAFKSLSSK